MLVSRRGVWAGVGAAVLAMVLPSGFAAAEPPRSQGPVGRWLTIDDDGKTPKSIVELYLVKDELRGKIVELINPAEKNPKCEKCEGARKNQPIIGLEIIWGLEKDGNEWSGGRILDPESGKEYSCYLEVIDEGRRLKVRGYMGIALLGRTQYWRRARARPKPKPARP